MFKNMKLSLKISLGFGCLILIALGLGSLASWSMLDVKTTATHLAEELVPEVTIANEVERTSLHTMYDARGYAFTEEESYLNQATASLKQVKEHIHNAQAHATKYNDELLKQNTDNAMKMALQYEQLLNQTVEETTILQTQEKESLAAADQYMKACYAFLDDQNKMMNDELDKMASSENINGKELAAAQRDRLTKVSIVNDIIDYGNTIRIGTWQAIANRDPELFRKTHDIFDQVNSKLDMLKAITKQEVNLKKIEDCRTAGNQYAKCMDIYLENWLAREELNKNRTAVGNAVLDAAKTVAQAAMQETGAMTSKAASSLSTATTIMIVGLCIGVVTGILLAWFITRSITLPINRIINGLTDGAAQVASAAGQVSAASQSLAQGATEQAAGLEETSSSLEEMSSMTKQNADNATQANTLAAEAKKAASNGSEAMTRMDEAIKDIQKSSDETAKIIKVIDEIAFQTNL
ncbi:MAG TPA: methyl-accepting chemotaxis protein, partial [Anaerohalosphaeraceae bacterium]|nr:methyl-accepting chemotaxis protein [Anaerohalosphaeraceae bacterium]